ncbi:hypothetical protein [Rathayibacter rathayi]|uniref:hypothetical protein n=1 Tax=Rathayibacter rathayi TaxID=33887 RepID=UPI000CE74573|nr:hypothetical protein [Rathayibacter rathayi]PPG86104.1 hypothetical protein C5C47_12615 [Rathayibacter rathayi]
MHATTTTTTTTTVRHLAARAYRDGKIWTIEIPELTSPSPSGAEVIAVGASINLAGIDEAARDLAAVWLDVDESAVQVAVTIEMPAEALQLWSEADETDKSARDLAAEGARLRARAVTALTAFGISKSDAAVLLHVSPQRVSQLVKVSA